MEEMRFNRGVREHPVKRAVLRSSITFRDELEVQNRWSDMSFGSYSYLSPSLLDY